MTRIVLHGKAILARGCAMDAGLGIRLAAILHNFFTRHMHAEGGLIARKMDLSRCRRTCVVQSFSGLQRSCAAVYWKWPGCAGRPGLFPHSAHGTSHQRFVCPFKSSPFKSQSSSNPGRCDRPQNAQRRLVKPVLAR